MSLSDNLQCKKEVSKDILFDVILKNADAGIDIVDSEGYFIYYNNAMGKIEGLDKREVLGKNVTDVYASIDGNNSTMMNCLKTGEPIYRTMQTYTNSKGEEIFCIITNIPIIDDGEIKGVVEFAIDMERVDQLDNSFKKCCFPSDVANSAKIEQGINHYNFENFKTRNKDLIKLIKKIKKMSLFDHNILIYGETGTGKEVLAQSIHNCSIRKNQPFIAQNCAAVPENLLESIFFGTEKGSFTGALDKPGLFEQADGGTLLLDELNSLPIYLQAKLLRVLQEGYVRRIGSDEEKKVDVRVISTINEDPMELIKKGLLREDLFYRIGPFYVRIPPLRERKEDIIYLSNYFIGKNSKTLGIGHVKLSDEVKEFFLKYCWRGNVRELKNIIEYAIINMDEEKEIRINHLPYYIREQINKDMIKEAVAIGEGKSYQDKLMAFEIEVIGDALKKAKGNVSEASRLLNIKRQTLQHKIKKYNINVNFKEIC